MQTLEEYYSKLGKYAAKKRLRSMSRKKYLESNKPKQCAICGFSNFFEVHHIISICDFSLDTPISEIVHLNNLQALCPTCHTHVHTYCD